MENKSFILEERLGRPISVFTTVSSIVSFYRKEKQGSTGHDGDSNPDLPSKPVFFVALLAAWRAFCTVLPS